MELEQFYEEMKAQKHVVAGGELMQKFHELSQEALKITAEINNKYHSPKELRKLFYNMFFQFILLYKILSTLTNFLFSSTL